MTDLLSRLQQLSAQWREEATEDGEAARVCEFASAAHYVSACLTARRHADDLDALLASLPDQGWQDISTAPKDGTEVVLAAWNDGLEKWLFGVGAMHLTRWNWEYTLQPTQWLPLPPRDTP